MSLSLAFCYQHTANRIWYESLNLTATKIRSLQHTRQCAVSHILNISGQNANFVCGLVDDKSLDVQINARRKKFVKDRHKYRYRNYVLHELYMCFGKTRI